jgi:hypothetical protein
MIVENATDGNKASLMISDRRFASLLFSIQVSSEQSGVLPRMRDREVPYGMKGGEL